ncbi:hypothetical protein AB0J55_00345 [Amycolatopsis sp. NPDC049688]|uniref:hypothetical protein n=1 Tax=Amycolatopsis sp. NPDC049688 TaxID=3154733 RepID=UPI00341AAC8F
MEGEVAVGGAGELGGDGQAEAAALAGIDRGRTFLSERAAATRRRPFVAVRAQHCRGDGLGGDVEGDGQLDAADDSVVRGVGGR